MSEPMSDEQVEAIRGFVDNINARGRYSGAVSPAEITYATDAGRLLADNDRLRARVAARDEIVRAVAENAGVYTGEHFLQCAFCGHGAIESRVIYHADDCEVEQARALLARSGEA